MLLSELQVLHDLNHPNIMQIKQLLKDKSMYYIVSEVITGGELADLMEVTRFSEVKTASLCR